MQIRPWLRALVLALALAPLAGQADTLEVIVGAPFIELQLFPGRGYPKFHAVEKNEHLTILKSRAGWYQVQTRDGITGWVARQDMKQIFDTAGAPVDFSEPGWSEAQHKPWQLGLAGGELDSAGAYSLYMGYRFTPNISTELRYTQAFGEFSNLKLATLGVVHQAFPEWRFSPFFTLGAGILKTHPDAVLVNAEDEEDTVISVGVGLMTYLSNNVMVRVEYGKQTVLTTREFNQEADEWKAGLSVLF